MRNVGPKLPTQGSNPHLLHWKAKSQPLDHQGSPLFDALKGGQQPEMQNLVVHKETFNLQFMICGKSIMVSIMMLPSSDFGFENVPQVATWRVCWRRVRVSGDQLVVGHYRRLCKRRGNVG